MKNLSRFFQQTLVEFTLRDLARSSHRVFRTSKPFPDTLASLLIDTRHLPAGLRDDHLCAEVVELVPELLGLELALDVT